MRTCLICEKRFKDSEDEREYDLCPTCRQTKIRDSYDYIANKEERKLIKQLIKLENLLS